MYLRLLLFLLVIVCHAQMPKKPPILPLTNDIPFIRCEVCQKAAKSIFKSVKVRRKEIEPRKLGEDEILNIVEKSCNPDDSTNGEWLAKLDIAETNDGLQLQEHSKTGRCREECITIAKTCEETIGDIDTDVSEMLWRNKLKMSKFINEVCHSMSNACKKITKKFVKGKRKDFKFVEMTEKDIEAAKLMKNMQGMPGMPGMEMYTPEDLENMREQLGLDANSEETGQDSHAKPSSSDKHVPKEHYPSSNLGFFDTVKAVGSDIASKVKDFFGYKSKSEL